MALEVSPAFQTISQLDPSIFVHLEIKSCYIFVKYFHHTKYISVYVATEIWFGGTAVVCVAGPLLLLSSSLPAHKRSSAGHSVVGPHSSPHPSLPHLTSQAGPQQGHKPEFLAVGGAVAPGWTLPLTCRARPAFMIIAVVEQQTVLPRKYYLIIISLSAFKS